LLLVEAARFSVEEASRVSHCKVAQVKLLLAGARARFANVVIAFDGRSID
jgi:DNA-directed RNA polymerase specialized sigma24 family protein